MTRCLMAAAIASIIALSPNAPGQVQLHGGPSSGVVIRQTVQSAAQVDSRSMSVVVPSPGVIETNTSFMPLRRLGVVDFSSHIQTDLPLGLIEVSLAQRTLLQVSGSSAVGPVALDVYLPTYDAHYAIQTQMLFQLGGTPLVQIPFQLFPNNPSLDPVYSVNLVVMFEPVGVSCEDIQKLIDLLDDDDPEIRDRATRDILALGERAIKKVEQALAGGKLSAEQKARLQEILPRLRGISLLSDPVWEGPVDAGQWNFNLNVYASVAGICDIHFMVGYPPGGGDPQAGYDPAHADIQLVGFPDGWSASYDKDTGEIVVECGGMEDIPLDAGSDYQIKISTPTMSKADPKPVGWHYTDSDGHKIGEPNTSGTLDKGPRF